MEVVPFLFLLLRFLVDITISFAIVLAVSVATRKRRAIASGWAALANGWSTWSFADEVKIGLLAVAVACGISWLRTPLPAVHDEFSYLLAADTFSLGRWTNPTHPMWQHFETMHVIQQPSYASKYPPGQGLVLAMGKILAGTPAAGLWLSSGLAAAAVVWMLRGWMPRRWALLGGLLTALHPGIQLVWTQTYWGGNAAFIGGALILGAFARLRRAAGCRDAVWMAVGLALLANTRPFEGAVAGFPVVLALFFEYARKWSADRGLSDHRRIAPKEWWTNLILPAGVVLGGTVLFMGYYNWRVTGDPWKLPYVVHERTYGATPVFLWKQAGPMPEYRHAELRRLHAWLRSTYSSQRTLPGFIAEKATAFRQIWQFYLGVALSFPCLALPWILRRRRDWLPVAMVAAVGTALLMTTWVNPHYAAPAGPAVMLLAVQGIRHWRICARRRGGHYPLVVQALVLAQLLGFLPDLWCHAAQQPNVFAMRRAGILRQLEAETGRHLVIVTYGPEHEVHQEWVYNEADIDAANVVWARSLGWRADQRLADHFADRRIWQLWADEEPCQLVPYTPPPIAVLLDKN